jgi:PAS domain S-box-containing protein
VSDESEWRFDELHPEAYRTLVEGVPAILYIDRPDELATNLYTSPQVERLLGFTPEEWRDDPELWSRQLHPEDRDHAIAEHFATNASGEVYRAEYRFVTKDGRTVWIRDEAVPVASDDGTLLFWRGVMTDITEQKDAEERLRWSLDALRRTLQQRRELARRLEHAQEAERRRIAADLHDDPIQVMSAIDMRLQMLLSFPDAVSSEELAEIETEVQASIERLRSMLFELRPSALEREGLSAALQVYLEHTARTSGWRVTVRDELDEQPDIDLAALLYRIAQEAIVNARKHASATRVDVTVASVADGFALSIRDDGVGFVAADASLPEPGHLGISTMLERAELSGGWARVTSAPGDGTLVECWLPRDAVADPGLAGA